MLIAEDLLLLLTHDESGKSVVGATELEYGLAGALLLELALDERIDVAGPDGPGRKGRIVVVDSSTTGDAVLDEALRRLEAKPGRKPDAAVGTLRKGLRTRLYERLAERRVLRLEHGKVLGLFPTTRWPAADSAHEAKVRQQLYDVLVVGVQPQPRAAALVSLLHAIRAVPKVVGGREEKRAVQARAKEVAEGAWAATAVRRAVDAVHAATVTAVTAAAVSAGAAGGS
jgi:hypothetical protein